MSEKIINILSITIGLSLIIAVTTQCSDVSYEAKVFGYLVGVFGTIRGSQALFDSIKQK